MNHAPQGYIQGYLCWQDEHGNWVKYDQKKLTEMLLETRKALNEALSGDMPEMLKEQAG